MRLSFYLVTGYDNILNVDSLNLQVSWLSSLYLGIVIAARCAHIVTNATRISDTTSSLSSTSNLRVIVTLNGLNQQLLLLSLLVAFLHLALGNLVLTL